MSLIEANNTQLYYETYGQGTETIVFAHGLLWSGKMFHKQVEALKDQYRIIVYDHRGQGLSPVTKEGYDMDNLSQDALELIKNLVGGGCHFVGLSMGGFVGMRLAARHPEWIKSLILMETSADEEPAENVPRYSRLNQVFGLLGGWAIAQPVMKIMFSEKFLKDKNRKEERRFWEKQLKKNRKALTHSVKAVYEREAIFDELPHIKCPTLIMVGDQDVATVPAKSERIHGQIPHSELIYLEGAGHTSSIEEPEQVNKAIQQFLGKLG